jgi:predicted AAA+ superfamily ATPase
VGRYRSIEVKPLSLSEYILFKDEHPDPSEPQLMEKLTDDYLVFGGMPEYVISSDPGYISELVNNVIFRDIAATYGVKEPRLLKDLYFLLMQRVGKKISYSKLARLVGVGDDAVKRYVGYFEDAFLLDIIEQDGNPNERKFGPKKCYAPDNGICAVISGSTASGPLAENSVFLHLKKKCEPRYYHRDRNEVDFLCSKEAYEVKYKSVLKEKDTKGLEAFKKKGLKNKWLITRSEKSSRGNIKRIPLWQFLIENS